MPLHYRRHLSTPRRLVSTTLLLLFFYATATWAADSRWVHNWTAPPSTIAPDAAALASEANHYRDTTLRLIVHTSLGGEKVRLRLSNLHGEQALVVTGASIALQHSDGQVVAKSLKPVTFSGNSGVAIPSLAVMLSDAVDMPVPAMTNVAVTLYFSNTTPFITRHGNANQSSWLAPGNQVMAETLQEANKIASWDFLTALEVETHTHPTVIAAVGDSITDGFLSTVDANRRWPDYLGRRLQTEKPQQVFTVVNSGISGNRVLRQTSPRFGENLLARLDRDVFSISGLTHMILLEGINDIGMGSRDPLQAVNADDLIRGYRQVIARAHAQGVKIFGATLLPYQGAAYYSDAGDKIRREVNEWIRNSGEYDGVIDFEKATLDPANPLQLRRDFTTDNLHPNDAGYKAMADSIDLNLLAN